MFLSNSLLGLHHLFLAAAPGDSAIPACINAGGCPEIASKSGALEEVIASLVKYFIDDPDSLYRMTFISCQVIAGIGALWFLTPILLDLNKQAYSDLVKKIALLFLLMLMFANEGKIGKSVAGFNYAFIQGIHSRIQDQIGGSTTLKDTVNEFNLDKQKVREIVDRLSTCNSIPDRTKKDDNGNLIPNPAFTECENTLRELIRKAEFKNPLTKYDFTVALNQPDFVDMSQVIINSTLGFSEDMKPKASNKSGDTSNSQGYDTNSLLIGWRAAIAIVPDVALIAGVLYFPIPLAFSFLSTSYLQAWFSAMWSVGFFKIAMTIFNATFIMIEASLAGRMSKDTLDLAMGIAVPTIAIALATGSGLGLSSLVSQGVSTLSSKLGGGSINDRVNQANTNPSRQ